MICGAVAVITQDLDDPTVAHSPVAAFIEHSTQLAAKRIELSHPDFNILKLALGNAIGKLAAGGGVVGKIQ
jgi:hypothetical protein